MYGGKYPIALSQSSYNEPFSLLLLLLLFIHSLIYVRRWICNESCFSRSTRIDELLGMRYSRIPLSPHGPCWLSCMSISPVWISYPFFIVFVLFDSIWSIYLYDLQGYRLIANSILPVSDSTIHYGSPNGGVKVHCQDQEFLDKMKVAADILNIKQHIVGLHPDGTTGNTWNIYLKVVKISSPVSNANFFLTILISLSNLSIYIVSH